MDRSFNKGLDKTIPNYQEGIIKLLKEIRDNLAGRINIPERLIIPPPLAKDTRSSFDDINKIEESISNQKLNEIKIKIGKKNW